MPGLASAHSLQPFLHLACLAIRQPQPTRLWSARVPAVKPIPKPLVSRMAHVADDCLDQGASRQLNETVIMYHYPCIDGIFAALSAHLHFAAQGSDARLRYVPNAVYAPKSVDDLQLQGTESVFLLDFAGPKGFPAAVAQAANRVMLLDHHQTASEQLPDAGSLPSNLEAVMDMDRSGATIARDYFKPENLSREVQEMIAMVEDGDLWRWKLPDSKAFYAGLGDLKLEYDAVKNPDIFNQIMNLDLTSVISKGRIAMQRQQELIKKALNKSMVVSLGGQAGQLKGWGNCLAVRAHDELLNLRSGLGNQLAEKSRAEGHRAIGLVAYSEPAMKDDRKIKCSLRSIGDEDTTEMSQFFGGGGHRNASSFIIGVAEFHHWVHYSFSCDFQGGLGCIY